MTLNKQEKPGPSGFGLTEEQRTRIFGKSSGIQNADLSRDQKADRELETFLKSFEDPGTASSPTTNTQTATSPEEEELPSRVNHDGTVNIHPTLLYPRTMSCRQAFDQAYYCQSLGGKFNDVYRFGTLRACSEQWGAFWFCMRTRTSPAREREAQIAEYYRDREERKKKQMGSSEDVWQLREVAVTRAFWRDPNEAEEAPEKVVE